MKKENIIYIGIAVVVGLLVGYFLFGGGTMRQTERSMTIARKLLRGKCGPVPCTHKLCNQSRVLVPFAAWTLFQQKVAERD